jgi:hypothetical protein
MRDGPDQNTLRLPFVPALRQSQPAPNQRYRPHNFQRCNLQPRIALQEAIRRPPDILREKNRKRSFDQMKNPRGNSLTKFSAITAKGQLSASLSPIPLT